MYRVGPQRAATGLPGPSWGLRHGHPYAFRSGSETPDPKLLCYCVGVPQTELRTRSPVWAPARAHIPAHTRSLGHAHTGAQARTRDAHTHTQAYPRTDTHARTRTGTGERVGAYRRVGTHERTGARGRGLYLISPPARLPRPSLAVNSGITL